MPSFWLPLCILFPLAAGAALFALPDRSFRLLFGTTLAVTTVTSALVWAWILWGGEAAIALIRFAPELELLLKTDGLGRFFLGVLATLWPLTVLYAGSYSNGPMKASSDTAVSAGSSIVFRAGHSAKEAPEISSKSS